MYYVLVFFINWNKNYSIFQVGPNYILTPIFMNIGWDFREFSLGLIILNHIKNTAMWAYIIKFQSNNN